MNNQKISIAFLFLISLYGNMQSASSSKVPHKSLVHAWANQGNLEKLQEQKLKETKRKVDQKTSPNDISININAPDADQYKQRSPLMLAVLNSSPKVASFLLENGANVSQQDADGNTALHLVAQRLIDRDRLTGAPRFAKKQNDYLDIANILLDKGADCTTTNNLNATPLHILAGHYRMKSSEEAKESRAKATITVQQKDEIVSFPEKEAEKFNAFTGAYALAQKIITLCPDSVNAQDSNGMTPLHWTAYTHKPQLSFLLMQNGAKPEMEDSFFKTALHWAAPKGDKGLLNQMLGYFQKIHGPEGIIDALNSKDARGRTPLHWIGRQMQGSKWYGHSFHVPIHYSLDSLEYLVAIGADPTIKDADNKTVGDWLYEVQYKQYPQEMPQSVFNWLPRSNAQAASSSTSCTLPTSNEQQNKLKEALLVIISLKQASVLKDVIQQVPHIIKDHSLMNELVRAILAQNDIDFTLNALNTIAHIAKTTP